MNRGGTRYGAWPLLPPPHTPPHPFLLLLPRKKKKRQKKRNLEKPLGVMKNLIFPYKKLENPHMS